MMSLIPNRVRPVASRDLDPARAVHVYPVGGEDLIEHATTHRCWCRPRLLDGMLVHRKFDS